ncbi:hypothetical protein GCM10009548_69810 [Streptomyces malaysiensis subsp. malaysiensis]|uniref:Recombinase family protein n=1 Tax=Streptomyces malaysiensis TaxID=92644 RepID=A0ABX6WIP4_STRMQ|nr:MULTISPECIES: recombinase family protein [Streptomyces]AUA08108.1 hypothetical protein CFP59_00193 [Streptomyces sp. M56]MYX56968.1 recombinase family protein [Streptomyces sp. SID8382]QPI61318.1 recombinase family protein [Streptomyces solisilvae]UHH23088.1 recombinase family protein [Streptomyces sp. HNM0561]WHX15679.1 recombinase family protein [Streptomyces sp. NA07423]
MTGTRLIGYAHLRQDPSDFRAQLARLRLLGVAEDDIYWDHRASQAGLADALAACRPGDMLTVTSLDRLAPSPEALEELTGVLIDREVRLNVGGLVINPANEEGRSLFESILLATA